MQPKENSSILKPPKYNLGDQVRWFRVPAQDFGVVVDRTYELEGTCQVRGWHYLVQLDPNSTSYLYCKQDFGFEDDLERLEGAENAAR